jgi:hypothetical protein
LGHLPLVRFVSVNFLGNQTESKQYPLATFNGNDVRLLWRIGLLELLSLRIRGRDLWVSIGLVMFLQVQVLLKGYETEPDLARGLI